MSSGKRWRALAVAHLVLTVVCIGGVLINQWWLFAAVEALSNDVAVSPDRQNAGEQAATLGYPSIGAWLMQGWDRRLQAWSVALAAISIIGSVGWIVAINRPRNPLTR